MIAVIETGYVDKAIKYIDEILTSGVFNGVKVSEIYLREKSLDNDTYTILANLVWKSINKNRANRRQEINPGEEHDSSESTDAKARVKLVVSYRDGLGYDLPGDIVHYSFSDFVKCGHFPENKKKSVSVHSNEEAVLAERFGADRLMTGHIFATKCKETAPRGLDYLSDIVKSVKIPVVAIGGIVADNYLEVISAGASDIAVMNSWRETR